MEDELEFTTSRVRNASFRDAVLVNSRLPFALGVSRDSQEPFELPPDSHKKTNGNVQGDTLPLAHWEAR